LGDAVGAVEEGIEEGVSFFGGLTSADAVENAGLFGEMRLGFRRWEAGGECHWLARSWITETTGTSS
jgi:hypothetical protein